MSIKRLSDTMIRAMLNALAYRGSDGRYQVLTRGSTRTALESRGMVEVEETHDEHGRPVGRHYLTPKAVAYLREALTIFVGQNAEERGAVWQEWLTSDRRHLSIVLTFLGLPADRFREPLTPPTAVEVARGAYERYTGAHGRGWARKVCTDYTASVRYVIDRATRRGDAVTVEDGGVIRVDNAGVTDPGFDGAGKPCPVWFVPVPLAAAEEPQEREDDMIVGPHRTGHVIRTGSTVTLSREPWRGGQVCGHQTVYGMGAHSERYCGARKAPGLVECAEHAEETGMAYGVVKFALGNAKGDPSAPVELSWEPYEGDVPVEPTEEERAAYAGAPSTCPKCGRERATWPLRRNGRCSPKNWVRCIRPVGEGETIAPADDRAEEIRQEMTAEAEQRPCPGCGAEPGEPCEPMSQCAAALDDVVSEKIAAEQRPATPLGPVVAALRAGRDRAEAAQQGRPADAGASELEADERAAMALAERIVPQGERLAVRVTAETLNSTTREERAYVVGVVATELRAGARYTGNGKSLVLRHEGVTTTVSLVV
ncbi:hypothetical protein [Streptomyces griseoaurantiacus]|uniref:hypothetical protein n=1 Tax=Streptomyces griseoaurantiacus TaxID=68213 RepID=UPI0036AA114B